MLKPQAALRKDKAAQPTLEHRHFAFIAQVIAAMPARRNACTRGEIARQFADACASSNPKFDRSRFLVACNVVEL